MIRVKICGMTRVQDALAAMRYGADAIGFVFAPSPRRVTIHQAEKISRALPAHIVRVGVFVNQAYQEIIQAVEVVGLDRVQFHGCETEDELRKFAQARVIKALHPRPGESVPAKDPAVWANTYLVDAYVAGQAGGTGQLANWKYAYALKKMGKPVILSGGLNVGNIRNALKRIKPYMVDVSSGVEVRPGIKHHQKMKQFIHIVKTWSPAQAV